MASLFSTLSNVGEAVSALSSLAFGAAGGVVLGGFAFSGFEVPDYVSAGGSQALVIHRMPGGERCINAMGDDPSDVAWSGMMMDNSPSRRARELERMRAAGKPLGLHFGSWYLTVLIRSFEARPHYSRVEYSISCAVLRNEATAPAAPSPLLTSIVGDDMASALASVPATLAPVMATAQGAVGALGKLVPGSPLLARAAATLGSVNGQVAGLANSAGAILSGAGTAASLVTGATSLSQATAGAGALAQSLQSASYLGRAIRNLT